MKLKPDSMKVMLPGKAEDLKDIVCSTINGVQLILTDLVKSLGVILDSALSRR